MQIFKLSKRMQKKQNETKANPVRTWVNYAVILVKEQILCAITETVFEELGGKRCKKNEKKRKIYNLYSAKMKILEKSPRISRFWIMQKLIIIIKNSKKNHLFSVNFSVQFNSVFIFSEGICYVVNTILRTRWF